MVSAAARKIDEMIGRTDILELDKNMVSEKANGVDISNMLARVGGDKDEHGCIGSAGYSWCELKQKCLRSWEESCLNEKVKIWKNQR